MHYPEGYFIRVTDEVKPRREYTIPASTFDPEIHDQLDKPATSADGQPLPPKHTPEALGEVPSDVPPTEFPPYDEWTGKDLKAEIDARNAARGDYDERLSKRGNHAALVAVLEADDARVAEPLPADDPEALSTSGQEATTTEGDV